MDGKCLFARIPRNNFGRPAGGGKQNRFVLVMPQSLYQRADDGGFTRAGISFQQKAFIAVGAV